MGKKLVLTGTTLTDLTAPKLVTVDQIESDGSLLLIDPTHPAQQWAAGVPASGSSLPNLLSAKAAAVYGTTPSDPTISYANLDGTTRGKVERTSKGGLHAIISQADARVADATKPSLSVSIGSAFRNWQYLHPSNALYISIWGQVTRAFRSGTVATTYTTEQYTTILDVNAGGGNQRLYNGRYAYYASVIGANDLGHRIVSEQVVGPAFGNGASGGWGTAPSSNVAVQPEILTLGSVAPRNNAAPSGSQTVQARWPSWVVYRVYIEDLTVSGRTYAQVDAIDYALYQKEVLTSGGRYYGDTFTDPTTIP